MLNTPAPALQASGWLNTPAPLSLDALRGRVVVLSAFQMLCPGCVSHGLPQATRLHEAFAPEDLQVIGLHSVFEHHAVMTPEALRVFVHEYRLRFPIAIDAPGIASPLPRTMQAYGLRGTPSLVLIGRDGRIALNHFGHLEDLALGALVGQLIQQPAAEAPVPRAGPATPGAAPAPTGPAHCSPAGCVRP